MESRAADADLCHEPCVHPDAVASVRPDQLADPLVERVAESFKALADPTRVRILHNLSIRELCVCDLAELLGMTQSAVSHQLRYLRNLRIVKSRRQGNTVYYTCDDAHIVELLRLGIQHAAHAHRDKGNSHVARP